MPIDHPPAPGLAEHSAVASEGTELLVHCQWGGFILVFIGSLLWVRFHWVWFVLVFAFASAYFFQGDRPPRPQTSWRASGLRTSSSLLSRSATARRCAGGSALPVIKIQRPPEKPVPVRVTYPQELINIRLERPYGRCRRP